VEAGHSPPNKIHILAGNGSQPLRRLPRRRRCIRQRLTHRPAGAPHDASPERHPPIAGIRSDTFELLHSRSLVTPLPFVIALAAEPKVEGNDWSRVEPHRASTSPPSGAKSDCHTHHVPGLPGRLPVVVFARELIGGAQAELLRVPLPDRILVGRRVARWPLIVARSCCRPHRGQPSDARPLTAADVGGPLLAGG
jgi:hypothetical protein